MEILLIGPILWFLCGIFSAIIASNKGRSGCAWFLLGVLFGPFGLLVAALPAEQRGDTEGYQVQVAGKRRREFNAELLTKKCPVCAEHIKLEALVCRFCGRKYESGEVEAAIEHAKTEFERTRHVLTVEEQDKLSRGLCPNCIAFQAFKRDSSANLLTCEVCGEEYPLVL